MKKWKVFLRGNGLWIPKMDDEMTLIWELRPIQGDGENLEKS